MLKLRIIQPGREVVVREFPGDEAVLGRAPGCDVVIPETYVSKRHAKVLAGLVVVDLGSSNGTHVGGQRIVEPVLLAGRSFRLGAEATDAVVEVEHEDMGDADDPAVMRVREELDAERRRNAALAAELDAARGPRPSTVNPASLPLVQDLRRELQDALRRVDSLKKEVEERDLSASEQIQVKLAHDALLEVQRTNEQLRRELEEARAHGGDSVVDAARRALAGRVAELESDQAELREANRRLSAELEASKAEAAKPAPSVSELFIRLQAENRELRAKLEAGAAAPSEGAPKLFFELQAANHELKKRVVDLEARLTSASAAAPIESVRSEVDSDELAALRLGNAELVAEVDRLKSKLQQAKSAAAAGPASGSSRGGEDFLLTLVETDVDAHTPAPEDEVQPFVVFEMFRCLRQIEKLVTRMAGDFIQLYDQRTMLPDVTGNLRRLLGAVIQAADSDRPRRELANYLGELRKWLVVALGANRRATERFVEELRSDLSERALTAAKAIPAYRKLTGTVDAELWARASAYLKQLTADVVEEKLQQLVRACAEEIRKEQDRA